MKKLIFLLLLGYSSQAQQITLSKWYINEVTYNSEVKQATKPLLTFYTVAGKLNMCVDAIETDEQIWGSIHLLKEDKSVKDGVNLVTSSFVWKSVEGNWKVIFVQAKSNESPTTFFEMSLTQISTGEIVTYSGILL